MNEIEKNEERWNWLWYFLPSFRDLVMFSFLVVFVFLTGAILNCCEANQRLEKMQKDIKILMIQCEADDGAK